ncbi:MAG: 3'-5' exonuclease [Clostridia bacterium]|nr:3'-5' exonuclease [Clostridia bacterium]
MIKTYEEIKCNSLEKVMFYLDNLNQIKASDSAFLTSELKAKVLTLNGNEIDVLKLIEKYGLKFCNDWGYSKYSYYMMSPQSTPNTYSVGPTSMYGHIPYKLNIRGQGVNVVKNIKSNYEDSYSSYIIDNLSRNDQYVVLDIETTGLDPIVDDIIQICIYENENKHFSRYLPLEKNKSNLAYEHNHIKDELLLEQKPLTQHEINQIIERFDLENKKVVIWTGKNWFDRVFLEFYFMQHNLTGLEKINFFNAKNLLDLIGVQSIQSKSKDSIAALYGIETANAHNALDDCRIEHQIIENLLNENYAPITNNERYENLLNEIKDLLVDGKGKRTATELYEMLCNELIVKNGRVLEDYDKNPRTRGKEWVDIHHIDEIIIDNIAVRTNEAKVKNDILELTMLEPFNKKERLVYATKVEHFLLHCLINLIVEVPSLGPHWLFGDLLKLEIGIFEQESLDFKIQTEREQRFYSNIKFYSITTIYSKILKQHCNYGLNIRSLRKYYKLDSYVYDKNAYKKILKNIK